MSEISGDSKSEQPSPKKRSVTSLTLGWLADRLRRSEELKEEIESGSYSVDTAKLAASMLNDES